MLYSNLCESLFGRGEETIRWWNELERTPMIFAFARLGLTRLLLDVRALNCESTPSFFTGLSVRRTFEREFRRKILWHDSAYTLVRTQYGTARRNIRIQIGICIVSQGGLIVPLQSQNQFIPIPTQNNNKWIWSYQQLHCFHCLPQQMLSARDLFAERKKTCRLTSHVLSKEAVSKNVFWHVQNRCSRGSFQEHVVLRVSSPY